MGFSKEDVIGEHAVLLRLRMAIEQMPGVQIPDGAFAEYDTFGVKPPQIYHSKQIHVRAVYLLLRGLDRIAYKNNPDAAGSIRAEQILGKGKATVIK